MTIGIVSPAVAASSGKNLGRIVNEDMAGNPFDFTDPALDGNAEDAFRMIYVYGTDAVAITTASDYVG